MEGMKDGQQWEWERGPGKGQWNSGKGGRGNGGKGTMGREKGGQKSGITQNGVTTIIFIRQSNLS